MNIVKFSIVLIALLITSVSWGQTTTKVHKNEPSRNIQKPTKLVKVNGLYFEDVNVLKSYFISGEIKNGFPGYNHALTKDYNALELKKWLAINENKTALTKEGVIAIENYINNK